MRDSARQTIGFDVCLRNATVLEKTNAIEKAIRSIHKEKGMTNL